MAKIVFKSGEFAGQEVELREEGVTMGRGDRVNLTLHDGSVSGTHLKVLKEGGVWKVQDLGSSNGTKLNGEKVMGGVLKTGDVVGLGSTEFEFVDDVAPAKASAPAAKAPAPAAKSAAPGKAPAAAKASVKEEKKSAGASKASAAPASAAAAVPKATQSGAALDATMDASDVELIRFLNQKYLAIRENVGKVVIGQEGVVEEVLIAIFAGGHALLVGVPGLAKTLLISTLSHVLDLGYKRVQFTPDLMPSDITGTDVLEEDRSTGRRVFRFVKGPVFTNMLLADEINRTPPKTQAALLEAMQERCVTVGAESYKLPAPFFVLATQNPIEQEGTYPLPEAQLDRFLFNITVNYPSAEDESRIIHAVTGARKVELAKELSGEQVVQLQQVVRRVPVADHVVDYARDLVRATRPKQPEAPDFVKEMVGWGAGPRAGLSLITAAKARAILHGRFHATTADVSAVALPVLRHRVMTTFNAEAAGVTSDDIVQMLLKKFKGREELDI